MPGDWLIRPCRERLRPASHREKYLTGPMFGDRDSDPPDRAKQAFLRHVARRVTGLARQAAGAGQPGHRPHLYPLTLAPAFELATTDRALEAVVAVGRL